MADETTEKKQDFSDPCQIIVKDLKTGERRICGAVKKSLVPHLKVHNTRSMKQKDKWTARRYRKEFPGFSLGAPSYEPTPEHIAKFAHNRGKYNDDNKAAKENLEQQSEFHDKSVKESYKQSIQERFEELWDQVNRDLPAKQWALEAARSEERIEEINRRYDSAFVRGNYKLLSTLMDELIAQQKILEKCMTMLDLTVKNRREKNQLGSDTVAQLVSNFGATLRRMPPEKRQVFDNRVKEVKRIQAEKARIKAQDLLDEQIEEVSGAHEMSESDIDAQIQVFIENAET